MNLDFKTLAILSAVIFFSLALAWMLAPGVVLSSWGGEFRTLPFSSKSHSVWRSCLSHATRMRRCRESIDY
jgi:hypothetical protein